MGGVFYFLLIRPQQKRVRAQQALVNAVEVGDEIMTTGGIFGTIAEIDDDEGTVLVEIAPGTRIRMVKSGISRRLTEDDDVRARGRRPGSGPAVLVTQLHSPGEPGPRRGSRVNRQPPSPWRTCRPTRSSRCSSHRPIA